MGWVGMKSFLRIGVFGLVGVLLLAASTEAGILEVYLVNENVRHTLYTLNDGRAEYVQLNKVAQLFQLTEEIDPVDGRIVLTYADKSASFFPDQPRIIANRRAYYLDIAPRKVEGIVMVPLPFLTDIIPLVYDAKFAWDPGKRVLQVAKQNLEILNLSSSPYGEYTRIIVDMSQAASCKVTEKLPSLVIFELPPAQFTVSQNPLQVNSRSVQHVKIIGSFGSTQIIVRLGAEFERYKYVVNENPPQLVIDVYNTVEPEPTIEPQATEGIIEQDITQESGQAVPGVSRKFSLRTIVIDPGHGGSDRGITISPQTEDTPAVFEKELTLKIARILAASLTQRLGVRVVLTREGDDFISAEERTTIANNNRADIFVSLHVNNAPYQALSGFEVYVMDYGSFDLPAGYEVLSAQSQILDYAQARHLELSKHLATQIVSAYEARQTGTHGLLKQAPLFTLRGATMPAVHIEVGYASNPQEQTNIVQDAVQQSLAAAITDGIAAFKKQEE